VLAANERENVLRVIACDKREAFAQGSEAMKQSILSPGGQMDCFAPLAMTAETDAPCARQTGCR
jgi:hypothetical protein